VPGWVGAKRIESFVQFVPGFDKFLINNSPNTVANQIHCPLFLFHADDDSKIPTAQLTAFANSVTKGGGFVTFEKVATGDHYDSMIYQGIPKAIQWLKSQK
jgi:dienelactone hydrolase